MLNKRVKPLFIVFLAGLLLSRLYNLPSTSRFTRDESSNLVDMHRIFVDREITLIGPVDVNNVIIYPSLTFYMLMPFAILGDFSTYSPAYGTAFYGILTVFILIALVKRINKEHNPLFTNLLLIWIPLVETSRWAWNPHLVPFMSGLALLMWLRNERWAKFASGVLFGASFYLLFFLCIFCSFSWDNRTFGT